MHRALWIVCLAVISLAAIWSYASVSAMQARIVEVFVELDELKARVRPMSTEIDVVNPVTGGCMTVTVQVPYQEDEDAMAKALDDAIRAAYKQWGEWKGQ